MSLIDECFSNNFIKRNKIFKVFMLSACWLRSSLRPCRRGTVRRCVLRAACSFLISSLSWFFLHSSGCYVKALLLPLFVAMVSSLWFPHFNFKEAWKDHLDFFFFCLHLVDACGLFLSSWLIIIYSWPLNNRGFNCVGPLILGFLVLITALYHPALSESPDAEPGIWKVNCKLHVGLPWWRRW